MCLKFQIPSGSEKPFNVLLNVLIFVKIYVSVGAVSRFIYVILFTLVTDPY